MEIGGYNLGLECIKMQARAFDLCESRIHDLLSKLEQQNEVNKHLTHLVTKLTHAKESKKADFTQDPETMQAIDAIHAHNPAIFNDNKTYQWQNEAEIDAALSALDAQIKLHVDEINQTTLLLNMRYEERVQYTESALKTIEICIRHNELILQKLRVQ